MIDIASVSPLDSRTELFEQYLLKHYIEGKDFPPSLWASDEIDRPRTTNCCESFHKYFQDIMNGHNPNIFKFLHKLDSLQVLTQMKLNAIEQGKPAKKGKKNSRKNHTVRRSPNSTKKAKSPSFNTSSKCLTNSFKPVHIACSMTFSIFILRSKYF